MIHSPGQAPKWRSPRDLDRHFRKHGAKLRVKDRQAYADSALAIFRAGKRFTYRDPNTADERVGYFDRRTGRFTALTDNEERIVTHFHADEQYVRRLPNSTYT